MNLLYSLTKSWKSISLLFVGLLLVLICILFVKNPNMDIGNSNNVITIGFDPNTLSENLQLTDFFDRIWFVKLETIDSIPVGKIGRTIIEDSLLIFHDNLERIWIYDLNGKFISVISKGDQISNGYENSSGFAFDKINKRICISDFGKKRILFYSIKGKFLGKLDTFNTSFISIIAENSNILGYSIIPFNISFNNGCLVKIDSNGNSLEEWLKRPINNFNPNGLVGVSFNQLYTYYGKTSLWEFCYDTIYRVENNELLPIYSFSYPEKLTLKYRYSKDFKKNPSKFSQITHVFETDNYIFFEMLTSKRRKTFIYDKNSQFVYSPYKNQFNNDMDGGFPFWPNGRINDSILYMVIHPKEIQNYWNQNESLFKIKDYRQPILIKAVSDSKILDNPWIVFAKSK